MGNIAVFPAFWDTPWKGITNMNGVYPVTHDGKSNCLRLGRVDWYAKFQEERGWDGIWEIDGMVNQNGNYIHVPVKPGDTFTMVAEVWASDSTLGKAGGISLGADVYTPTERIRELFPRQWSYWGHKEWQLLMQTFTIQDMYEYEYKSGTAVPTGIIPWMQGMTYGDWNEEALSYIRNTQLYINEPVPEPEPEPEPEPQPKPTYAARTIGPLGVPEALLHKMWLAREKVIRPEVHKKLHPVV